MRRKNVTIFGLLAAAFSTFLFSIGSATALPRPVSKGIVHPGAKVLFEDNSCTMNFVFKGSNGQKYVGTAGHCPLADVEATTVWKRGEGIRAQDASGVRIGEFVFAAYSESEDYDFALIRLDRNLRPNPQMEYFGGPTGINDEITTISPELINIYGQGTAVGEASPQRQLLAPNGFDDREVLFTEGAVAPGDSGAPATSDSDEALGVVVAVGAYARIPESGPPYPGVAKIVRLPHNLALAEDFLGIRLKILVADPL